MLRQHAECLVCYDVYGSMHLCVMLDFLIHSIICKLRVYISDFGMLRAFTSATLDVTILLVIERLHKNLCILSLVSVILCVMRSLVYMVAVVLKYQ